MAARGRGISSDIALRITPKWDIEFGEAFITLNPPQGKAVNGYIPAPIKLLTKDEIK